MQIMELGLDVVFVLELSLTVLMLKSFQIVDVVGYIHPLWQIKCCKVVLESSLFIICFILLST